MFCQHLIFLALIFVSCSAQDYFSCLATNDDVKSQIQIIAIKKELKEKNITSDVLRGYANLDDGWIAPFNGYQYKKTPNNQSWDESRSICQSWGGDLLANGVHDPSVRSAIIRGLSLRNGQQVWIGLTDRESQGLFVWVNGERAPARDGSLWHPGQPNGGDCGSTLLGMAQIRSFDEPCFFKGFPAICERLI